MHEHSRRTGDAVAIDGSYQHDAIHHGPALQRAWHREKLLLFAERFPVACGERGLDVGCGSGVVTDHLAELGCSMLGVDGNPSAIEFALHHFGRDGCQFELALVDDLEVEHDQFDFAVCLEVIEHLYEEQGRDLVEAIRRKLKPGGRLCLTTPNYRGTWPVIEWAMDKMSKAPKLDEDQHVSHYRDRTLGTLLTSSGFDDVVIGTFSTVSPFVGAISSTAQTRVARFEERVRLPFGNILVATARTAQ